MKWALTFILLAGCASAPARNEAPKGDVLGEALEALAPGVDTVDVVVSSLILAGCGMPEIASSNGEEVHVVMVKGRDIVFLVFELNSRLLVSWDRVRTISAYEAPPPLPFTTKGEKQ